MTYDYSFFDEHARRRRTYSGWNAATIDGEFYLFYRDWELASRHYEVVFKRQEPLDFDTKDIIRIDGACSKGGQSLQPLLDSLKTDVPEDFRQFYETYGETMIFSRGSTVWIMSLAEMIDLFEDEPDIEITEGRFFRFAKFDGTIFYLALRRDDQTDEWQMVLCSHGLLYSEMIGPEGREEVFMNSFYEWLKDLVTTNRFPNLCASGDDIESGYLEVIDEGDAPTAPR